MKKKEFGKIYDRYAPRIYRFICLKVSSPRDSEDLTSEVFLRFWKNISEDEQNKPKIDNPRALLYKIANNLVIDFYRKKSRTELIMDPEDSALTDIRDKFDLNSKLSIDSDMDKIKKAISQIKDEYQNIIIWRYLDDFSNKEIANILEKPEGTIRVLVHRALKELKRRL
ncbi:MAG: RNA polymerase sigma factor [Patescibacteria group bacterium]|nr:RNA polymerase sigma factor [Patescibacteria group bacterium]